VRRKGGTLARMENEPPNAPGEGLKAVYEQVMVSRFWKSWFMADRRERRTRLRAVESLSVELAKIREQTIQATGLAESVIEDIIEGDWDAAGRMVEHLTFADGQESYRAKFAPIFEDFVLICRTACAEHARGGDGS
jgi:hypothetical protein